MLTRFTRALDVRPAEVRAVSTTFASLLLIVVAHAMLETARDALFLVHVGPGALGYMYIGAAAVTLLVGAASARIGAWVGARAALVGAQIASAAAVVAFYLLPPSRPVLIGLYAWSAISGAVLVPQLWSTTASLFHAGQGRRLFGLIALAGVAGGVLGSSIAALLLQALEVRALLLGSAVAYVGSAAAILLAPAGRARDADDARHASSSWLTGLRSEPVLVHVALIVALGAGTSVLADFMFKSVATARVPPEHLGSFFARYALVINVLALVAQLLASKRILARAGVLGAVGVMPSTLFLGSVLGFLSGGTLLSVVAMKAVDGALRHSVHRTGLELVYLAVPAAARDRVRPVIDGSLPRLAQAATAGLLLALAAWHHDRPREIAMVTLLFTVAWSAATASLYRPYIELFRRALVGPQRVEIRTAQELDLASVELLVETLGSERPKEVVAAIDALTRRGRAGLVPALVLLREEPEVLELALAVLGPSGRGDWVRFAIKLASDPRERVRRAAMRALARAAERGAPIARSADDEAHARPWVRGYLAVSAIAGGDAPEPHLARLDASPDGREVMLGMLTALEDAPPTAHLAQLLVRVLERAVESDVHDHDDVRLRVAAAASRQQAVAVVPHLVEALVRRETRDAVHAALVALEAPAFEHLAAALNDPTTPRALRVHLPFALAELGSRRSADVLLRIVRDGGDGRVRYRCLRALERMVTSFVLTLAIADLRDLVKRELVEHFRVLALAHAIDANDASGASANDPARVVLAQILEDKRWQAVSRALLLVRLCFPAENVQRVFEALRAPDAATRGNAVEFLDALLLTGRRGRNASIRSLLRLVAADTSVTERLDQAAAIAPFPRPAGADEALDVLAAETDQALAAVARDVVRAPARGALTDRHARRAPPGAAAAPVPT